jgi:hypothetical protein
MRDEFEAFERAITRTTDLLLGLADDNQDVGIELQEKGDKFALYHRGKYDAYSLAAEELDSLRMTAKRLKDSARKSVI